MRALAFTILTMSIALAGGQARAQVSPAPAKAVAGGYCLQGCMFGYPGDCQFSSYAQCMATASGVGDYCVMGPRYAFAHQRAATIGPDTQRQRSRVSRPTAR